MTKQTLAAHQRHHGTSEVSDMILAARIQNGWSEPEIAANYKSSVCLIGGDDDQDNAANGYYGSLRLTAKDTAMHMAMDEMGAGE
jgi:hypothetical protein